jgi:hypothetical protein
MCIQSLRQSRVVSCSGWQFTSSAQRLWQHLEKVVECVDNLMISMSMADGLS